MLASAFPRDQTLSLSAKPTQDKRRGRSQIGVRGIFGKIQHKQSFRAGMHLGLMRWHSLQQRASSKTSLQATAAKISKEQNCQTLARLHFEEGTAGVHFKFHLPHTRV